MSVLEILVYLKRKHLFFKYSKKISGILLPKKSQPKATSAYREHLSVLKRYVNYVYTYVKYV